MESDNVRYSIQKSFWADQIAFRKNATRAPEDFNFYEMQVYLIGLCQIKDFPHVTGDLQKCHFDIIKQVIF